MMAASLPATTAAAQKACHAADPAFQWLHKLFDVLPSHLPFRVLYAYLSFLLWLISRFFHVSCPPLPHANPNPIACRSSVPEATRPTTMHTKNSFPSAASPITLMSTKLSTNSTVKEVARLATTSGLGPLQRQLTKLMETGASS